MATDTVKHLGKIPGVQVENWIEGMMKNNKSHLTMLDGQELQKRWRDERNVSNG